MDHPLSIAPRQMLAGHDQHRRRRRHGFAAAGRPAGRPGRCGDVRRQVARQEPHLPLPRRSTTTRPSAARRSRPSAAPPATAIGQWASDTAADALASVLAPQPHHRGQPSDMIATLATGMALQMGLPQEEIERIRIASLLHDLGKLAVPARDPGQAQRALRPGVAGDRRAPAHRPGDPRAGHEPARGGPRGAASPRAIQRRRLPARPARQGDPARRPHRGGRGRLPRHDPRPPVSQARDHAHALAELRGNAGTQFDPEIVDVFCEMFADGVPRRRPRGGLPPHERARDGFPDIQSTAAGARSGAHRRASFGSGRSPRSRPSRRPSEPPEEARTRRRASRPRRAWSRPRAS